MKILTWNVRKASASSEALWDIVRLADPDIALLQELTSVPNWIKDQFHTSIVAPKYFSGKLAPFSNAVLAKWPIQPESSLSSSLGWVNSIHQQTGWLLECQVEQSPTQMFRVICVHSPAFPIPKEKYKDYDVTSIKLPTNPDLWFTEILWSLLKESMKGKISNWIVAGDFNTSVLLDQPRDRGNGKVICRLNQLGLTDCLSHHLGKLLPTFRHSNGSICHQLDYCYVSKPLLKRLKVAWVLSDAEVFGRKKMLSDHLPIICEFN